MPDSPPQLNATPQWAPAGFVLRRARGYDFVFESSLEALAASGLLQDRAVPPLSTDRAKPIQFATSRYGEVVLRQRTARTFFVVMKSPKELRYAAYEAREYDWCVYHEGTKQQLQERGVAVGVGFPGEPGCNKRKVTLPGPQDGKIELLGKHRWCGEVPRYEVFIRRSEAEQAAAKRTKSQAEDEKRRLERLKTMAATPAEFRDDIAEMFWAWGGGTKNMMQSQDGYRFTPEVVEEFMDAVREAYWVIKEGHVTGSSPRDKLRKVLSENAKADAPLQRFLASAQCSGRSGGLAS